MPNHESFILPEVKVRISSPTPLPEALAGCHYFQESIEEATEAINKGSKLTPPLNTHQPECANSNCLLRSLVTRDSDYAPISGLFDVFRGIRQFTVYADPSKAACVQFYQKD